MATTQELLARINEAFLPSAPVHRQELLAGRQDQLFALLEVTQTRGAHAALFGERGVGKTSVAAVIEVVLRAQDIRVARINCSAMNSFTDLWTSILDEWVAQAADEHERDVLYTLANSDLAQATIVRHLGELTAERSAVLIFDEFDVLADDGVGADFANLMKAISDKGLSAHIVMVGVAEDVDTILQGHASAARGLHQIKLPRLTDAELRSILTNGFGMVGIQLPGDLATRVVRLSQGLPHYTHLLGKELARRAVLRGSSEVVADDWTEALKGALSKAEQQVVDLYSDATTTAKPSMLPILLLACALAPKGFQGFFRPADVHAPLNRLSGKTYAMAAFTGNLASLAAAERGPALQQRLFADRRKRYRFANPLLQPYVLAKAVLDGHIHEDELDNPNLWS